MIGAIPAVCQEVNCEYKSTMADIKSHWIKCDSRIYKCTFWKIILPNKTSFKEHIITEHESQFLMISDDVLINENKLKLKVSSPQ